MGVKFMRKHQQKQILNLIATLSEANAEIKRLFLCGKTSHVLKLLEDCQDGVVQIGEFIESVEGKGTQTVALLEEYHESLYSIAVGIGTADANFVKRLKKQLLQIENSVRREFIQDRIEIAFLPYKASMWDSLESIWLAAKDDPRCDAYVVPIPYFDRLPSGALGQMKYEGHQYPDYVPVVNYRAYDIEARQPDIIFIHNPYDDGNCITSVHPDYYSDKLKNCTELLCYVPYFVVSNDVQEHFVLCSGVINADRVFIQSKEVRDTYVRICEEFEKEHKCKGSFGNVQSKFIASGSPKFERVLHTKRENYNLPEDWQKLIGNKKVIFYNTSIGAILQGNEQYLEKLRYVLDTFRNRSDVVLWWRPHPLNEATYQSMRPHLLEAYEQIVADFRRGGWGIYDDMPDFHCAVSWTDGYYGDPSSVATLYAATGKPVLIGNLDISSSIDEIELMFENICDGGNYLWCTSINFNSLFRINKETWIAEHIGFFENEELNNWRAFFKIIMIDERLIFVPYSADNVTEYLLEGGSFRCTAIENPYKERKVKYNKNSKFTQAFHYKDSLFFTPHTYPGIIRYDLITGKVAYYSDWIKDLEAFIQKPGYGYFIRGVLVEGRILLACSGANAVFEFDIENYTYKIHEIRNGNMGYIGICFDGNDFWLVPTENGSIVRWNPKSDIIKEYNSCCDTNDNKPFPYQNINCENGNVYVLPVNGSCALKISISDDTVEVIDAFQDECELENSPTQMFQCNYLLQENIDGVIYAYSAKTNQLLAYNDKTGEIRKQKLFVSKEHSRKIRSEQYQHGRKGENGHSKAALQEYTLPLADYLRCVVEDTEATYAKQSVTGIGEKIYKLVKEEVMGK
jgi:hypothetical protein